MFVLQLEVGDCLCLAKSVMLTLKLKAWVPMKTSQVCSVSTGTRGRGCCMIYANPSPDYENSVSTSGMLASPGLKVKSLLFSRRYISVLGGVV